MKNVFKSIAVIIVFTLTSCGTNSEVDNFHQGYAVATYNDRVGFIDKKGKWIISPIYDYAGFFNEGLAAVAIKEGEDLKWGYINKNGEQVIPPQV